jgi:hypothetical protein
MDAVAYIPPSEFDVFLPDVRHEILHRNVAEALGIKYLEEPDNEVEVGDYAEGNEGILYGSTFRPMINLLVSSTEHGRPINIIYLIEMGSPNVYICEKTMEKLGFVDHVPSTCFVKFAEKGLVQQAYLSHGNFADVNIIGSHFLHELGPW